MEYKPFAYFFPVKLVNTDAERFQNRTDAFSELSAEQVAENFDLNKFDAIILWKDDKGKYFVLSGHSRLEGMKRRKESFIPARFFEGSESEAIKFARIDANRLGNKENLIEDLKAYKLSKEGAPEKNIKPLSKSELKQAFKGKESKLDNLSYLSPTSKFIERLNDEETITQFPRIQNFAAWSGELTKKNPTITQTMQDDMFNFFFGSAENYKTNKEDFEKIVKERLLLGKPRLFPECAEGLPCHKILDLKEVGANRETIKELTKISNQIEELGKRFSTTNPIQTIYTQPEKQSLLKLKEKLKGQQSKLKRDLNIVESQENMLFASDSEKAEAVQVIEKQIKKNDTFLDELKRLAEFSARGGSPSATDTLEKPEKSDYPAALKRFQNGESTPEDKAKYPKLSAQYAEGDFIGKPDTEINYIVYYKTVGNRKPQKHLSDAIGVNNAKSEVKEMLLEAGHKKNTFNILKVLKV